MLSSALELKWLDQTQFSYDFHSTLPSSTKYLFRNITPGDSCMLDDIQDASVEFFLAALTQKINQNEKIINFF
jgi:hypothetical protein